MRTRRYIDPIQRDENYLDEATGYRSTREIVKDQERDERYTERETTERTTYRLDTCYRANPASGDGTYELYVPFFTATGTVTLLSQPWIAPRPGRITGGTIRSNEARTAGTAQLVARIDGTDYVIEDAELNDVLTLTASAAMVASTIPFAEGDEIYTRVKTVAWTPTTADFAGWLTVAYDD